MAIAGLPDDALAEVERCVRSVVQGQRERPDDDFYMWTKDYGSFGRVHLSSPPGRVGDWAMSAVRQTGNDEPVFSVFVEMWTDEEGRSELSLDINVQRNSGRWVAEACDLHVL